MKPRAKTRKLIPGAFTLTLLTTTASAQDVCQLPDAPLPSQQRAVLLLDTSGSMIGKGDGKANIFEPVKSSIRTFLEDTRTGGHVELSTFDAGPRDHASFTWPQERAHAGKTLDSYRADGQSTFLYRSMVSTFNRLARREDTATTAYVITDGQNNDPDRSYTIHTALRAFERTRGPYDKLYYVALGATIPQDVKDRFEKTGFARTIELPAGVAPTLLSATLAPALLDVEQGGRVPLRLPPGARLGLDSSSINSASITLREETTSGFAHLNFEGNVKAGSVALLCVHDRNGQQQNILLRFNRDFTGAQTSVSDTNAGLSRTRNNTPSGPRLKLLNPEAKRDLARGQHVILRYRVEGGPMIVQLGDIPESLKLDLPDQAPEVQLSDGQELNVTITNHQLPTFETANAALRLGTGAPFPLPPVRSVPRDWTWLFVTTGALLAMTVATALFRAVRRNRTPVHPIALSVDAHNVYLHDTSGRRAARKLKHDRTDVGKVFGASGLHGLTLERYRAQRDPEQDPETTVEARDLLMQLSGRAVRLAATTPSVELRHEQESLAAGAPLTYRRKYLLGTPPPPSTPEPPAPPTEQEPLLQVLVTLTGNNGRAERELPPGEADLGVIFQQPALLGVTVQREPRALRLIRVARGVTITHISRDWEPGEALPLGVMLSVVTSDQLFGLQIQDRDATARLERREPRA